MPNEQGSVTEFFKRDQQPFNQAPVAPSAEEELPEDLRNRHVRRLEEKLQKEREANIEMSAKYAALSEAKKFREETKADDLDQMVARIYGTDKPENAAATELLQKAMQGYSERAKRQAIEEIRNEFRAQQEEDDREAQTVQSYIEDIELRYGVDLTGTDAARERQKEFRNLWFRLSPKDRDGEVAEYADPYEVWEIYQSRQPRNPALDYAARGMQRSNPVQNGVDEDATYRYLQENGILPPPIR